jgi:hypothetical protein
VARCATSDVACTQGQDDDGDAWFTIDVPAGAERHAVALQSTDDIESILALPIERTTLLGEYAAICSCADGFIEAALTSRSTPRFLMSRRLFGFSGYTLPEDATVVCADPRDTSLRIVLGRMSAGLGVLSGFAEFQRRRHLSMRIEGLSVE